MKKITKVKNVEIKKDQLLCERNFLGYCNDSNNRTVTMTGKFHRWVDGKFLRAVESDEFIKPILTIDELVRQSDGSVKEEPVHYYSPFQIYIVTQLSHNTIDDEGKLRSPDSSIEWQIQQKVRYVAWGIGGAMSFNMGSEVRNKKSPGGGPNVLTLCGYLNDFLRMLHSLDVTDRYSGEWRQERGRYYSESPNLQFNFDRLKGDKATFLDQFDLDVEKIEILRKNIGQTALIIDPLEKWYPFLQKLPQWRRDELKGEALLAQDLYGLCEIIADILEIVTGTPPAGLLESLRSDFAPAEYTRNEYASGTDIEAIKLAASKLKTWMADEKSSKLLNEISASDVIGGYSKRLEEVEQQLKDYKKHYEKYGEGRSINSGGFLHMRTSDSPIPITALDPRAKKIVEQMMAQRKAQGTVEDEDAEMQWEINHAIRWRLDDIKSSLTNLIYEMIRPLDAVRWKIDSEKQNGQQHVWWGECMRSGEAPTDAGKARVYYFEKFQPRKIAEYDKKLKPILDASRSLGSFASLARLVLCAHCRKNTVLLHQAHNDKRVSSEAICDECIKNGELQKIKGAEWSCRRCGKKIYTFAHGNILSDVLFNTSNATIRLDYGRMTIRARCTNKDCKEWNEDHIDWGWLH